MAPSSISTSDLIQLIIALATLFAVIVALFGQRFWGWKDKPKVKVSFDENDPEFFHQTDMHIIQNGRIAYSIPTYYVRLKVTNLGKTTLENTEVVLEKVIPQQEKFMSLNLSWAGFITTANDITRTTRIPPGQSRIVDVIEVMEPQLTSKLAGQLESANDTDAQRYRGYSQGFRCCSIKPNSLSDIFPADKYTFQLGVYSDNLKPKNFKLSIKYDGKWNASNLEMRKKHLLVKLFS